MAKTNMMARAAKRSKMSSNPIIQAKRDGLKATIKSDDASYDEKQVAIAKLSDLPRDGSKVRSETRCKSCGRNHAVYKNYLLCRLCIRKFFNRGWLPGFRKASR